MEEWVEILKSEYDQLKLDSKILEALRTHGVDNWEWYDDALSTVEELNDD